MTNQIKTLRLTLRAPQTDDAAQIAMLIGDLDVSRWLSVVPHPYSTDDALDFIRNHPSDWRFLIETGGQVAGMISITDQLGYWLGKPLWGQGLMSEAARALLARWFDAGQGDVTSGYFTDNARSGAILQRLGFRPTELVQDHCLALKQDRPLQKMRLSAQDWQARRG